MVTFLRSLAVAVGLAALPAAQAPVPPAGAAQPDLSREAFIILQSKTFHRFEADGTGRTEVHARIKPQTEAGIKLWGELAFGYNAANERIEIEFVRVHKQDGSVVTAPLDAVQDLTSPVERIAPVYTDFKQKNVTVPSLRPGETIEFKIVTTVHTPFAPGHFWTEYDFNRTDAVLDEQLEIDVPASVPVTLKTEPGRTPVAAERDGRRSYRWTASHFPDRERDAKDKNADEDADDDESPRRAPVRLTTFQSWADVAKWYGALEAGQRKPTPEVRRKAEELVKRSSTSAAKAEALYDFVAKNFRYVSLSLGMGRYQPRPAGDVLRDQYGDCKDKHTLLASLLESVGVQAHAALINSRVEIDPDFPSPSQFDHVVTAIRAGGETIWLDSTTEVAPFRMLSANLRKRPALVVAGDSSKLEETPADPPVPNRTSLELEGVVDDSGKLRGTVRLTTRGDAELLMRMVFRNTSAGDWKEVFEGLHETAGIGGEISDWKVGDPADTAGPFTVQYVVNAPGFVDRSKKETRRSIPFAGIELPDLKEEKGRTRPYKLGSPIEQRHRVSLKLPAGLTAKPPLPVSVARDYAQYNAAYSFTGGVFSAERSLKSTVREIAASRSSDYAAFRRAVAADAKQQLSLEGPPVASTSATDATADDLHRDAVKAHWDRNYAEAERLLVRAVEVDPAHSAAWGALGRARLALNKLDEAVSALRKQIEINAFDEYAYPNLGLALYRQRKYQEAEGAFRKQLELNPLDEWTLATLGEMYVEWKRNDDAVVALEKALSLNPKLAGVYVILGRAHLNGGRLEPALAAFDKAVELEATPLRWNDIAYQLSLKGVALDRALRYAESAVSASVAASRNVTLDLVTHREIGIAQSLAAYWDTLGWVYFAQGDIARAEPLVAASWHLAGHSEVADHLAQIHERRGRRDEALMMYALAIHARRAPDETRARLAKLAGGDSEAAGVIARHARTLEALGTIPVDIGLPIDRPVDLLLLVGAEGVQGARVLDDAARHAALAEAVRRLPMKAMVPPASGALVVRRATVACTPAGGKTARMCTLTLHPLDTTKPPS